MRTLILASVLALATAPAVPALSIVHVDFQADTVNGVTAPGYTAVNHLPRWDYNNPVDLGSGIKGAWAGYPNCDFRDRATADPLLRDFLISGSVPFQLRGLEPGTYDLTLYATDASPEWGGATQQRFDMDSNNDSLPDASLTLIEPQHQTQGTVTIVVSPAGTLSITCIPLNGAWGVCNGFDLVAGTPDTTPPAAVADLGVTGTTGSQAMLQWTAPLDNPGAKVVSSYDIRYSTSLITEANWASATQVAGEPAPATPGQSQTYTVSGLTRSTTYFFAISSIDASGNVSVLSNVPSATTSSQDTVPPAAITDLAVMAISSRQVTVAWTAPADDLGTLGKVASYDLRYSTDAITEANWAAAMPATGLPAPIAPGQGQTFTVAGLSGGTQYYFAIKSIDASGNVSVLSNVLSGTTQPPDLVAPAATMNLAATGVHAHRLTLSWKATGDDGMTGTAATCDIRCSTTPITNDSTFAAAMILPGAPAPAAPGTLQTLTVTGLTGGTTYWFAMKVADEWPNWSSLSNVVQVTTPATDVTPTINIPLTVEEHNGAARSGEVVSGGVPFAMGTLSDYTGLHVEDSGGSVVPCQFQVLNRWWAPYHDDSIKWLLVTFPASVAANGTSTYYLKNGGNAAPAKPVSVAVNGELYTIDTGAIKAVINAGAFKLFDQVWYDANGNGQCETGEKVVQAAAGDGVVITSGEWSSLGILAGQEFRASGAPASVTVEEAGPVRAVVCVQGQLQRDQTPAISPYYEYTVRLYFYAGSPTVRCHMTLRNNRLANSTVYAWPIEDMSLRTTLSLGAPEQYALLGQAAPVRGTLGANTVKIYQDSNGTDNWLDLTATDLNLGLNPWGSTIRGVTSRGYQAYDGSTSLEQNNHAKGWIDLNDGTLGVAAGVRDFWQQYPKAIRANGARLEVGLLPTEWSEVFSLHEGSRKRHEVVYDFHAGALSDTQLTSACLQADRPLHMRCGPQVYIASGAWDGGLGPVPNPGLETYDKAATTGSHIGSAYGWDWYGNYYGWNPGGMHENEGSMFMPYVLWGDWRNFERAEIETLWGDLAAAVMLDAPDQATAWHYLMAGAPFDGDVTEMRYPGWYDRALWGRPDSGHCGMWQHLEYYYLTGDRHALEQVIYYGQMANWTYWPRYHLVPTWYSTYHGDPDDPSFQVSDRYYGWPMFDLVQAYEATGDMNWLTDAAITLKGTRNTLRQSPLKFANEVIYDTGNTSDGYYMYWPADTRAQSASQGFAIFQICIMAKAAGLYYLATGDMDAFDVMVAQGDFLGETAAIRDAGGNLTNWPYCWADYWGPTDVGSQFHPDLAGELGWATHFARKAQRAADLQKVWQFYQANPGGNWSFLGWMLNEALNPPADQTPPAAVGDLQVLNAADGSVLVRWTAPGDNGNTGTGAKYQLKYSTSPIVEKVTGWPDRTLPLPQTAADYLACAAAFRQTQLAFVSAINTEIEPPPAPAGTLQWARLPGLEAGQRYYFAIKSLDAANNLSDISNVPSVVAGQYLGGDVNGDGAVDVVDLLYLVDGFGSSIGEANYDPAADFNADGSVDVIDLLTMVENFGKY